MASRQPAAPTARARCSRSLPPAHSTLVYSFTGGSDGYSPVGALARGSDCNFYGVTTHSTLRGFELYGTVFRITPSGALTTLHTLR